MWLIFVILPWQYLRRVTFEAKFDVHMYFNFCNTFPNLQKFKNISHTELLIYSVQLSIYSGMGLSLAKETVDWLRDRKTSFPNGY